MEEGLKSALGDFTERMSKGKRLCKSPAGAGIA